MLRKNDHNTECGRLGVMMHGDDQDGVDAWVWKMENRWVKDDEYLWIVEKRRRCGLCEMDAKRGLGVYINQDEEEARRKKCVSPFFLAVRLNI